MSAVHTASVVRYDASSPVSQWLDHMLRARYSAILRARLLAIILSYCVRVLTRVLVRSKVPQVDYGKFNAVPMEVTAVQQLCCQRGEGGLYRMPHLRVLIYKNMAL